MAALEKRFAGAGYTLSGKAPVLTIEGYNISDAVMNEVKTFEGVVDVRILPHWAENAVLAKKINLGLDLQGGMSLVLRADFENMERRSEKKLTDTEKSDITSRRWSCCGTVSTSSACPSLHPPARD
jgi:hypothetical protein